MHEIYGSICQSKCESGFDWSTFPLAAVIFDWLWPKGLIVNIKFSLPDHMAVVHLKKKLANAGGCVRERLGNDQGFHQLFACGCPDKGKGIWQKER